MDRVLRGGSIVSREGRVGGVSPPLARDEVRYNLGGIVAQTLCYCERTASSFIAAEEECSVPSPANAVSNRDSAERWSAR